MHFYHPYTPQFSLLPVPSVQRSATLVPSVWSTATGLPSSCSRICAMHAPGQPMRRISTARSLPNSLAYSYPLCSIPPLWCPACGGQRLGWW